MFTSIQKRKKRVYVPNIKKIIALTLFFLQKKTCLRIYKKKTCLRHLQKKNTIKPCSGNFQINKKNMFTSSPDRLQKKNMFTFSQKKICLRFHKKKTCLRPPFFIPKKKHVYVHTKKKHVYGNESSLLRENSKS